MGGTGEKRDLRGSGDTGRPAGWQGGRVAGRQGGRQAGPGLPRPPRASLRRTNVTPGTRLCPSQGRALREVGVGVGPQVTLRPTEPRGELAATGSVPCSARLLLGVPPATLGPRTSPVSASPRPRDRARQPVCSVPPDTWPRQGNRGPGWSLRPPGAAPGSHPLLPAPERPRPSRAAYPQASQARGSQAPGTSRPRPRARSLWADEVGGCLRALLCRGARGQRAGRPDLTPLLCSGPRRGQPRHCQGPGVERQRAGRPEQGLTFAVRGVWRQADVHGPLDRTIEAVGVRARVTGGGEGRRVGAVSPGGDPGSRAHADTRTWAQIHARNQRRGHAARHTEGHETTTDRHADT